MESRELAGLECLESPPLEGHVVACRRRIELVVPSACRRLTLNNPIEGIVRDILAIRILRHRIGLAQRIGRDQEGIFVAIRSTHDAFARGINRNLIAQPIYRLTDDGAEVAFINRCRAGKFAMGEIRQHGKAGVGQRIRTPRPAAVRVLCRFQPPKDLVHAQLCRGISVTLRPISRESGEARRARTSGDQRTEEHRRINSRHPFDLRRLDGHVPRVNGRGNRRDLADGLRRRGVNLDIDLRFDRLGFRRIILNLRRINLYIRFFVDLDDQLFFHPTVVDHRQDSRNREAQSD